MLVKQGVITVANLPLWSGDIVIAHLVRDAVEDTETIGLILSGGSMKRTSTRDWPHCDGGTPSAVQQKSSAIRMATVLEKYGQWPYPII